MGHRNGGTTRGRCWRIVVDIEMWSFQLFLYSGLVKNIDDWKDGFGLAGHLAEGRASSKNINAWHSGAHLGSDWQIFASSSGPSRSSSLRTFCWCTGR